MPNPSRLDLVHKAIGAGIFGNIEWKPESYARVRADAEMQGYTPEAVRLLLRQYVLAGTRLSVRQETREERREEDLDNPYWYRAIIPVAEFPKGLFVEVVLIDYDETEPFVMIVSAHPQLSQEPQIMPDRPYPKTCWKCRSASVVIEPIPYSVTIAHDGRSYEIHLPALTVPRCANCGAFTIDYHADREIDLAFHKAAGLLAAHEIAAARARLGLTPHDFATLLGVPDTAVALIESGAKVQPRLLDSLIRGVLDVPEFRAYLSSLHGLTPTAA